MTISANDFLMGGGVKSASFPAVGTTVTGQIVREPEVQQQKDFKTGELKFWANDGTPMQQLKVVLATDLRDPSEPNDDGERAIYVKGNLLKAVRDAVRRSGAKGLEVGGILAVTYSGDGIAQGQLDPPKLYTAVYTPAARNAATEFINGGQPAAPAAPAQPVQPVAQPVAPAPQPAPVAPAPVAPAVPAAQPAAVPPNVGAEALAALQALTPEQRAALGL